MVQEGRPWSFDDNGSLLRLVSEAPRIRLAHLFDPYLAIHTSRIEPLPHQITAVYGEMLARQPLRFLLADVVRGVLAAPEQRDEVRPGRDVFQSRIAAGGKTYLIRVFVDVDRGPAEIVTVYRTSRVAKYWRAQR